MSSFSSPDHGLWFEQLQPGRTFRTGARVIDAADIAAFAALSGDDNPLHVDAEHARAAGFEGPIAHGLLGTAVLSGLIGALRLTRGTLIALVGVRVDFVRPIPPGTEVRAVLRVDEARPTSRPDRGLVVLHAELQDADGAVVQRGEFVELVRRRPAAGEASAG